MQLFGCLLALLEEHGIQLESQEKRKGKRGAYERRSALLGPQHDGAQVSSQSLLVKNQYLVLEEPPLFASDCLDVDHSKFLDSVTYSGDASSGYIASLDLQRLKIKNHCLPSLSTVDWKYHPSFKIQKAEETSESKRDALFNLCLHVLANLRWSNGNLNFYVKYLVTTKELLVLVPSLTQASTVKVVSVVYREKKRDHRRVYNHWFWETPITVVASHPTMIGKDNIHLCDGGLQS
jgi:hypothetical protein